MDALEKQILNSLWGSKSVHPFPMASADAPSAARTARSAHAEKKLSFADTPMMTTASSSKKDAETSTLTKASLKATNDRERRMKRKLAPKNRVPSPPRAPPASPPPTTRHFPAAPHLPFPLAKRAPAQPTQALTQPTHPLTHAVAPEVDFAASLTSVSLSFNMASMSLDQGVSMVEFLFQQLFQHQYANSLEDTELYMCNLYALREMAKDMGVKTNACTFGHWVQIGRSLIAQICAL